MSGTPSRTQHGTWSRPSTNMHKKQVRAETLHTFMAEPQMEPKLFHGKNLHSVSQSIPSDIMTTPTCLLNSFKMATRILLEWRTHSHNISLSLSLSLSLYMILHISLFFLFHRTTPNVKIKQEIVDRLQTSYLFLPNTLSSPSITICKISL